MGDNLRRRRPGPQTRGNIFAKNFSFLGLPQPKRIIYNSTIIPSGIPVENRGSYRRDDKLFQNRFFCHPERSERATHLKYEILRYAQNDNCLKIEVLK
jgi:hypothetical protein